MARQLQPRFVSTPLIVFSISLSLTISSLTLSPATAESTHVSPKRRIRRLLDLVSNPLGGSIPSSFFSATPTSAAAQRVLLGQALGAEPAASTQLSSVQSSVVLASDQSLRQSPEESLRQSLGQTTKQWLEQSSGQSSEQSLEQSPGQTTKQWLEQSSGQLPEQVEQSLEQSSGQSSEQSSDESPVMLPAASATKASALKPHDATWTALHNKYARTAGLLPSADVIFFGDSLTEGWLGTFKGASTGLYAGVRGVFESVKATVGATTVQAFGIAGDTVDDVRERIEGGEFPPSLQLRVAVVCAGINDVLQGRTSAATMASKVASLAISVRKAHPSTSVLVLGLLPEAAMSKNVSLPDPVPAQVNVILASTLKPVDGVSFLDCSSAFTNPGGSINAAAYAPHPFPAAPLPRSTPSPQHPFPAAPLPRSTPSPQLPFPAAPLPRSYPSPQLPFSAAPLPRSTPSPQHPFPAAPLPRSTPSPQHPFPAATLPRSTPSPQHPFPAAPLLLPPLSPASRKAWYALLPFMSAMLRPPPGSHPRPSSALLCRGLLPLPAPLSCGLQGMVGVLHTTSQDHAQHPPKERGAPSVNATKSKSPPSKTSPTKSPPTKAPPSKPPPSVSPPSKKTSAKAPPSKAPPSKAPPSKAPPSKPPPQPSSSPSKPSTLPAASKPNHTSDSPAKLPAAKPSVSKSRSPHKSHEKKETPKHPPYKHVPSKEPPASDLPPPASEPLPNKTSSKSPNTGSKPANHPSEPAAESGPKSFKPGQNTSEPEPSHSDPEPGVSKPAGGSSEPRGSSSEPEPIPSEADGSSGSGIKRMKGRDPKHPYEPGGRSSGGGGDWRNGSSGSNGSSGDGGRGSGGGGGSGEGSDGGDGDDGGGGGGSTGNGTNGNVTHGDMTHGNVTRGNETNGNITDGNVTGGSRGPTVANPVEKQPASDTVPSALANLPPVSAPLPPLPPPLLPDPRPKLLPPIAIPSLRAPSAPAHSHLPALVVTGLDGLALGASSLSQSAADALGASRCGAQHAAANSVSMLDQSFVVLPPNSSAFHGASYGTPHAPRHGAAGGAIRPSINPAISAPPLIPRPPTGSPVTASSGAVPAASVAVSPAAGSAGASNPSSIPEEQQPQPQDQTQEHPQQRSSTAEIQSQSWSQLQRPPRVWTSRSWCYLARLLLVVPITSASYTPCVLAYLSFAPPSRFPRSAPPAPPARLDESFVVLPGSAASLYAPPPALPHAPSSSSHARPSPHTHPFPLPPTMSGAAANAPAPAAIPPSSPAAAATAAGAARTGVSASSASPLLSQGGVAAAVAVTAAAAAAGAGSGAGAAGAAGAAAPSSVSQCYRGEGTGSEQVLPENVTVGIGSKGFVADAERGRGGSEEKERRGNVEEERRESEEREGERGDGMRGGPERGGDREEDQNDAEGDDSESGEQQQQQQEQQQKQQQQQQQQFKERGSERGAREVQAGGGGLAGQIEAVDRVFDLVALRTKVEMPLCCHCAHHVCREIDAQVREAEEEIAAYEAALQSILASAPSPSAAAHHPFSVNHASPLFAPTAAGAPMGEDAFRHHMAEVEEEERRLQQEAEELEQQRAQLRAQLGEVEAEQAELDAAVERYWHEFNEFQYQVSVHQEARDGLLASIEVAAAQSDALRRSFVLNDAFHIWHDGDFGTINNLRLGRLPSVPVEWEELNAAWGQACHLLFTLARIANCPVAHRIIPMGSFPRVSDGHNQFELFGPVNLFWSTRYDRAMLLFLHALTEFAAFANAHDRANHLPPEKSFQLPYKIEGDKIQGLTVKQSFNREERWTKALKYLLCDLKWALVWTMTNFHPPLPTPPPAILNLVTHLDQNSAP
ncbi:unnamed protein product [Closterium sp. NIES-64]|nr:unnamed protein product [Closterium sp. NIES-64]